MIRMRKKLVFITLAVLLVFATALGWLWHLRSGLHKMRMPGKYQINLAKGPYAVWYFWSWPSKGIRSELQRIEIKIVQPNGSEIQRSPWPPSPSQYPADRYGDHVGREELQFEALTSGMYTVECASACVLVVVPTENYYHSYMDRQEFEGINDEFKFEPESSTIH